MLLTDCVRLQPGSGGYERGSIQFSLGGALSGTPLHWHNDAINYLVRGTKLWSEYKGKPSSVACEMWAFSDGLLVITALQPPSAATYSRVHAQIEAAAPLNRGLAFRCVQVRL